jgi:sulfur relay (sulfurtransferase) complex TusBCD TusD component (DsrE family)
MQFASRLMLSFFLIIGTLSAPAFAADPAPLFLNLTVDNSHQSGVGLNFAKDQFERGHPLTIFLNDRAVRIGATANTRYFISHQELLRELIKKGATVLVCRPCALHYGVSESNLMPGMQIAYPDVINKALFRDNTRTLTW